MVVVGGGYDILLKTGNSPDFIVKLLTVSLNVKREFPCHQNLKIALSLHLILTIALFIGQVRDIFTAS